MIYQISFIMKNIFTCVILLFTLTLFSQNKLALVIGNSEYESSPLRNATNDAKDIAIKLINLGFDVTVRTNLNQDNFECVIRDFTSSITKGDIALFFYSGHGMQVQGENYFIPLNKKIYSEEEIKYKCTNTGYLLDKLHKSASGTNIIILDACRDNPFSGFRSSSKGFTAVIAPSGTIISYSTAPGTMAYDGEGRNSPYTESLLECLDIPNLQIEEVFKEVRNKVISKTFNRQIPWESSSLLKEFYFDEDLEFSPLLYKDLSNVDEIENKNTDDEEFSGNKGTFIDERDNQEYKWVRIGDQIWMAENLNIGEMVINKKGFSNNGIFEKYCNNDNLNNCLIHGGFYSWDEVMQYSTKESTQGICPDGWHVPSDSEWIKMEEVAENNPKFNKKYFYQFGWRGTNCGKNLKSIHFGRKRNYGEDLFDFNVIPNGSPTRSSDENKDAFFYTSTFYSMKPNDVIVRFFLHKNNDICRRIVPKGDLLNVRCIKN